MSPETPEIPSRPDLWFSSSSIAWPPDPVRMRKVRMPGSIEPERVPIINPSSGVKPMVVSTLFPLCIAASEQPFPR